MLAHSSRSVPDTLIERTLNERRDARTILEALKTYGMLMADNGIDLAISIAPDERIPELHEELRKVKIFDFEVVTPPAGYIPPQ